MSTASNFLSNAKHLKSDVDVHKLGPSGAEVCFLGRSNVGKSSLINALCNKKSMAHSSQVPGKTRTMNVYEVTPGRWVVDLPGYGFAVGGPEARDELGAVIESYLKDREALEMVYVLVDAVAGPTKSDSTMIDWLKYQNFPFSIVVHKIDKIASPKLEARKQEILKALFIEDREIFWVSSTKGLGIPQLQQSVAGHLHKA